MAYCQFISPPASDSYDYSNWGIGASLMYESLTCGSEVSNLKFSWECWSGSRDLEYCAHCISSSNCFGCVGLQKKQYCIFNKQYSKDGYEKLVLRIKEQMRFVPYVDPRGMVYRYGEFFPPVMSPFAYNETYAQDFFPLDENSALESGFPWRTPSSREYIIKLTSDKLPDNIQDVNDIILTEVIACKSCRKAYRIANVELAFLRRSNLPIPRFCHNCRFAKRFAFVNPPKLRSDRCQCAGEKDKREIYKNTVPHAHGAASCANEFLTAYRKDSTEIVYCEKCYQQEVY